MNNPFGAAEQERCKEILEKTLKSLCIGYAKGFAKGLVAQAIENREAAGDDSKPRFRLAQKDAEPPSRSGFFEKRGAVKKNWKKRFFVVEDNLTISYKEKADSKKAKGNFNLCGLTVRRGENLDEVEKLMCFRNPEMGLALKHSKRREWYFEFETKEDKDAWEETFEECIRKTESPLNEDPVLQSAFISAYESIRTENNFWSWYTVDGSETEMLSYFLYDLIDREVLGEMWSKVDEKVRKRVGGLVKKSVEKLIQAALGPAWSAAEKGVLATKDALIGKVEKLLGPLVDARSKLHEKMVEKLTATLGPAATKVAEPVLKQVFEHVLNPLIDGHMAVHKLIAEMCKGVSTPDACDALYGKVSYIVRVRNSLWKMRQKLRAIDSVTGTIDPWNLAWEWNDQLHDLARNAVYTLQLNLKGPFSGKAEAALKDVADKMLSDSKVLLLEDGFLNFMKQLINPLFEKAVLDKVTSMVEPLDSMIPDPVKEFFSVGDMLNEVLSETLDECLLQAITAASSAGWAGIAEYVEKLHFPERIAERKAKAEAEKKRLEEEKRRAEEEAAIKIQAAVRGRQGRKKADKVKAEKAEAEKKKDKKKAKKVSADDAGDETAEDTAAPKKPRKTQEDLETIEHVFPEKGLDVFKRLAVKASVGTKLFKHNQGRGKPKEKIVAIHLVGKCITWRSKDGSRMPLEKVQSVAAGKDSVVFQKSKKAKDVDAALCFTITSSQRTLDFQCPDQETRDLWVSGLQNYIDVKIAPKVAAEPSAPTSG